MKRVLILICSLLMLVCLAFSACAPTPPQTSEKQCKIVLSESNFYTCTEYVKTVARGGNVEFTLKLAKDYTIGDTSYGDFDVQISEPDANGSITAKLTLKNVKYSSFVSVDVVEDRIYSVKLNPSSLFRCEEAEQFIHTHGNAVFTLLFKNGYTFESASFEGLTNVVYHVTGLDGGVDENNERQVILTVENIQADTSVTVTGKAFDSSSSGGGINLQPIEGQAVIGYALNGGSYKEGGSSGSYFTINYPLSHYPRPNTSIGTDVIEREGYTLTGWNTQSDGKGQHIGLGSRAPILKGETLLLYAEWAKWTDAESFDYVLINSQDIGELYTVKQNDKLAKLEELSQKANSEDKRAVITHYDGKNDEVLVIPEKLDGYTVSVVATYTILDGNEKIKTIIFPLSVRYIMGLAFVNCQALSEIYIYDSLFYIDYNAFGQYSPIQTLHINAKLAPIYGATESAQFANKLELIMDAGKGPRTIIFGSCTTWYGIIAEDFGKGTGRTAYNMGVEGDTCTLIQCDIIRQYMREGDTLIYMCDLGSPYLWGYEVSFDPRVYRMMEHNYDLLSTVNMQRYSSVLSALNEYLTIKNRSTVVGTYEDYYPYITEYGDLTTERDDKTPEGEYLPISKSTLEQNRAFDKLKEIFQSFVDIGVDIYFGMSTISNASIAGKETLIDEVNDYVINKFNDGELNIPATLIGDLKSSVLPSEYFYEIYRLTREGAKYFTPLFIERFKAAKR